MNNPELQHIVPKAYLKKFAIDEKSKSKKSMVECLRIYPRKFIEQKSVDSKFFKTKDYYTANGSNPYRYENYFSRNVENEYNNLLDEMDPNNKIDPDRLYELLYWIYISKYRNSHYRDTIKQYYEFKLKWSGSNGVTNLENKLDEIAKLKHLEIIGDIEHFKSFASGMLKKDFLFLSPYQNMKFITNDNPGFSVNINDGKPNYNSFNVQFATNSNATNYFPLTSNKCLAIIPPEKGRKDGENYFDIMIDFREIDDNNVKFINFATYSFTRKFCVANSKEYLEPFIEIDLPEDIDYSQLPIFQVGGSLKRESNRKKPWE